MTVDAPVRIFPLALPKYDLGEKLDYGALGEQVDSFVCSCFADGKYVERSISSRDHPEKSQDELAGTILASGTDKYDPSRREVAHNSFRGYDHDFHGAGFEIRNGKIVCDPDWEYPSLFADIAYHFCEHAPLDRGHPVRIDLLIFYHGDQIERAEHVNSSAPRQRPGVEHYLFRFRDSGRKRDALAGVVTLT